jgi:HAD superfamily hydrolase (TIGR01509 family)
MNIIIPLGGKGERFSRCGYSLPKPLIKVLHKEMIFHVLDNLNFSEDDRVFIIHSSNLNNFSNIILTKYQQITLIPLHYETSGAVETIYYGLDKIITLSPHKKCVLFDCDTFYTQDILEVVRNATNANIVFYTEKFDEPPIYSYISLDSSNKILEIKEKNKISSNANTGCYSFNDIGTLLNQCRFVLENKITFNGEPYTSCVIDQIIKTDNDFFGYELQNTRVFSLGTPTDLTKFIDNTFVFLFDLDGTIVNTDHIYFNVWKKILFEYNITLDFEIFNKYIHGNSDNVVVKLLLPKCNVNIISALKDKLFIENIKDIRIIDGAVDFITNLRNAGFMCSIVTNCNRNVAEKIICYCGLTKFIDFITIGNECAKAKPHPDPYLETILKYNVQKNKCIIFEDSKSGLLSARLSDVHCIVGITTNYNRVDLLKNGANITIDNYININLDQIFCYNKLSMEHIKTFIKNSLNLKINNVNIDETRLKGGYISDVIALKIETDSEILDCVLKIENKNETKLSIMASTLGLYERENYFYDAISKYINISCPKFYGLIKDDNLNTIGILMENLNTNKSNILNLDLNIHDINISLQVISELARFHSKFWNKDLQKAFPQLKKHNDPLFNPVWTNFINENWSLFLDNWTNVLTPSQIKKAENIKNNFQQIQDALSSSNLTLVHGDVKSPNIFYNLNNHFSPIFLDWQYIAIGKGVQDVVFFLIESFDIESIRINFPIFKNYYYKKLLENGVTNYSYTEFETDWQNAVCYFPFFVAVWFGTTPQDELIDKNFPFFFIQKLFLFLSP